MKGAVGSQIMNVGLTEADYKKVSNYEKNFSFKKKVNDPRFGEISIIQNPSTREVLAVAEKQINDKKEAGQFIVNCKKRLQNQHPNVLGLKDYSVSKVSQLCSSFFVIKQFYEFPRSDLNREFQQKEKNGQSFSHEELTHILYQQIDANAYLEKKNLAHGDIQPLNIAYDSSTNTSKLIDKTSDSFSNKQNLSLQSSKLASGKGQLYQSPLMFSNLKKKKLNFQYNQNKEDMYGLGLTLLQLGNGKSVQDIYNKGSGEVDKNKLHAQVNEFEQHHGQQNSLLVSTVKSMLEENESNRPDFNTLKSKMPSYEDVKKYLANQHNNTGYSELNPQDHHYQVNDNYMNYQDQVLENNNDFHQEQYVAQSTPQELDYQPTDQKPHQIPQQDIPHQYDQNQYANNYQSQDYSHNYQSDYNPYEAPHQNNQESNFFTNQNSTTYTTQYYSQPSQYYAQPNESYQTYKNTVTTLEPEYRTEYISKVDINEEQNKFPNQVVYSSNDYQTRYQPQTVRVSRQRIVSNTPQTVYQSSQNIIYSEPQEQLVTVYRTDVNGNTTMTQEKRASNVRPSSRRISTRRIETRVSNSRVNQPVEKRVSTQRIVEKRVSNARGETMTTYTSQPQVQGLRLVRTYEDPKYTK